MPSNDNHSLSESQIYANQLRAQALADINQFHEKLQQIATTEGWPRHYPTIHNTSLITIRACLLPIQPEQRPAAHRSPLDNGNVPTKEQRWLLEDLAYLVNGAHNHEGDPDNFVDCENRLRDYITAKIYQGSALDKEYRAGFWRGLLTGSALLAFWVFAFWLGFSD